MDVDDIFNLSNFSAQIYANNKFNISKVVIFTKIGFARCKSRYLNHQNSTNRGI